MFLRDKFIIDIMIKQVFILTILVVFIAVAAFFFTKKARDNQNTGNILMPTATPIESAPVSGNSGQVVTLPNGLKIQDIIIGPGQEARSGNAVSVNYEGTLENGTKFDSSYDRGTPFSFILGAGQVIQGWDLGVAGMKVGGKRKLIIPSELGYGAKGAGGVIPPNAALVFEVELLSVQEVSPR
jgi:FKBP-type peptidyl-prolyl cis-trans isomerase